MKKVSLPLGMLLMLPLLFVTSCGDDPASPGPGPGPEPDPTVPEVPTMTDPQQDPPAESETLSVDKLFLGSYSPVSAAAKCDWTITGRGRYQTSAACIWLPDCYGGWETLFAGTEWSDQLPTYHGCFGACGLVAPYCPEGWELKGDDLVDNRFLLVKDGVIDVNPNPVTWETRSGWRCRATDWICGCISRVEVIVQYEATPQVLESAPYLRRERFWKCTPWPDGSMMKRQIGSGENWVGYEYTKGSSVSEMESFAWTLGVDVGVELEGVKAGISGSITTTFSQTVTVSESQTIENDYHLIGEEGKETCHVLWTLVERYSFVHEDGTPFSDSNYKLAPLHTDGQERTYDFEILGTQEAIAKYVFDAGGKLQEVRVAVVD